MRPWGFLLASGVATHCFGCLPDGEVAPPGALLVSVEESAAVKDGFVTDDGWNIQFDRFVVGLGQMSLRGAEGCIAYSDAVYVRLFDFTVAPKSRVAAHFGLGPCAYTFGVAWPYSDTILMDGVTRSDQRLMAVTEDVVELQLLPASMWIVGTGAKGGTKKRFSWLVRQSHDLNGCYDSDGALVNQVRFEANVLVKRSLEIHPQELFRERANSAAKITFGRFAQADSDADGEVTLEELGAVPVSDAVIIEAVAPWLYPEGSGNGNLEVLVRDGLSSRVAVAAGADYCDVIFDFDFGVF